VSILIECIGILAYVEYGRRKRKVLNQYTIYEDLEGNLEKPKKQSYQLSLNNFNLRPKPKNLETVTAKKDNSIGFKHEPKQEKVIVTGVKNEVVKKYIELMKNSEKESGEVDGIGKISKAIGISENAGKKIHGYLEQSGMIKIENRKTYIAKGGKANE
jgi:hypothetical protein